MEIEVFFYERKCRRCNCITEYHVSNGCNITEEKRDFLQSAYVGKINFPDFRACKICQLGTVQDIVSFGTKLINHE